MVSFAIIKIKMLEFFSVYSSSSGERESFAASLVIIISMVMGAVMISKGMLVCAEWYAQRIKSTMEVSRGPRASTAATRPEGEVDVGTTHVVRPKQDNPKNADDQPKPIAKENKHSGEPKATVVSDEDVVDMDALLDDAMNQALEHEALLEDALLMADAPPAAAVKESSSSEDVGSEGLMDAVFDEIEEGDALLDEALLDVQTGKAPLAAAPPVRTAPPVVDDDEEDGLIAEMRRKRAAKRKAAASQ